MKINISVTYLAEIVLNAFGKGLVVVACLQEIDSVVSHEIYDPMLIGNPS